MANDLPRIGQDLTINNKAAGPFYLWFRRIQSALDAGTLTADQAAADIRTISLALGSPDGTPENIPSNPVVGVDPILVFGTLADGLHISLASLEDTETGTFKLITRDNYGRVEGTEDGDTDDVPEGVTNLYHTPERVRDVIGAALVAGTNITITVNDPGDTITIDAAGGDNEPSVVEYFCTHFASDGLATSVNTGVNFVTSTSPVAYVGGSTGAASITASAGRPGQALLSTGINAGGYARMCVSAGLVYVPGGGVTRFGAHINLPALSNGTNRYTLNIGFLDVISGATTNRIEAFYRDDVNSGNWRLSAVNAGVTTNVDTATVGPVAATETFVEIEINAAGTSAELFIDGVSVATVAITITAPMALFVAISKSAGTTNRTCLVNYCEFLQTFTTPR